MTITSIPLSKLKHSPVNVRKTGGQSIDDLAASIEAHGLIQSLTVREAATGKYEVVAGGRRLSALIRLMKEKRSAYGEPVTKAFPVPCRVLADEDAAEISLAENAIRQAMHPADQFDAFKALADGGMSSADIAARFGASERTVEQRLKLALVSPKLLAVYRDGKMTLEQLEAFTVTGDAKRQEKVWKAAQVSYNSHPSSIRRQLTDGKVSAGDRKVRLIGLDTYLAAGGTVTRDLFSEREDTYLDDPSLVDRLVEERLTAEAGTVKAEGWAWVRVFPDRFWPGQEGLRRIDAPKRPLTAEEVAQRARLIVQRDDIEEAAEASEEGWSEEQDTEFDRLTGEISAIDRIDRVDWSGFDKASAGAAISFDWEGDLAITRGLVSMDESKTPEDMAEEAALPLSATGKPAKPKAEFSTTLLADLSAQRTMAMRAKMEGNPTVALDTLIWTLASSEFFNGHSSSQCAKITAVTHFSGRQRIDDSVAGKRMALIASHWRNLLPDDAADLWQWVRDAVQQTKLSLLAYLVANSLDATQINGAPATANSHAVHEALGLDMAGYFDPFISDYLARVNRTQVLEAVEEAVSPEAARALNGKKKAELVAVAEVKLKDSGWIPKPLRLPEAGPDAANGNEGEGDREAA